MFIVFWTLLFIGIIVISILLGEYFGIKVYDSVKKFQEDILDTNEEEENNEKN